MQNSTTSEHTECTVCGTSSRPNQAIDACPACGAPIVSITGSLESITPARLEEIRTQVESVNERLLSAGSKNAESAFNLGCGMSLVLILLSSVLVYFLAGRSWLLVLITALMAMIAGLWIVTLLSSIARSGAIRYTYENEVRAEVEHFVQANGLSLTAFEALAHESLTENAPLRKYLGSPKQESVDVKSTLQE